MHKMLNTNQYLSTIASAKMRGWSAVLVITLLVFMMGNTPFKQPMFAALFFIYFLFGLRLSKEFYTLLSEARSLMGLWLLFVASYFWSVAPDASLSVIISQSTFLVLAILITLRHRAVGFASSLRSASLILTGLVGVYCFAFWGESMSPAGLKGFFVHKNVLGAMMALCALTLFFAPRPTKVHIGIGIIASLLLAASQSATSIILFFTCVVLVPLVSRWINRNRISQNSQLDMPVRNSQKKPILFSEKLPIHRMRGRAGKFPTLFLLLIAILFAMFEFHVELLDFLMAVMPEESFTGRGMLWLTVLDEIRPNVVFGIGPGALWNAGDASVISNTMLYKKDAYWVQNMGSSDGGYIDLVASLGVVGLGFFIIFSVDLYRKVFRHWAKLDMRLMFVLVTFVLFHAVTESTIMHSTNIHWLVCLLVYLRLSYYDLVSVNLVSNIKRVKSVSYI
jgi:hypothetical protein